MTIPDLPEDVLQAIDAGRTIEAIKLLREQRNLSLKEAKEAVEALEADIERSFQHPDEHRDRRAVGVDPGPRRFVLLVIFLVVAYLVYRLLVAG